MKTAEKQIVSMLQAFNKTDVLKAFELYQDENALRQELQTSGLFPQKTKPENQEFYFLDNAYWVQSLKKRQEDIKKAVESMKAKQKMRKPKQKTSMGLKRSQIKCPACNALMYKQAVCGGCADGKKGYKIRLICEENPDHEVLL
ncbi:hypothetical protein [Desulfobacula toluolica]|uniref:Uncharacterized protein n=1 Tax=Desulfobacula toluolica (strain DSM 7467 / Tol2) TaxID=651182 RepID=K0NAP6_DESTT|nr:hypothetical protein [Desulfobacula toluolica]CCK81189.1 uncharacterized protein TOL2_C30300 [Desulfobacula toluolica Tol2]